MHMRMSIVKNVLYILDAIFVLTIHSKSARGLGDCARAHTRMAPGEIH